MNGTQDRPGVLRSEQVNRRSQPVLVDSQSAQGSDSRGSIAIIPVVDDDTVAGLEVRCNCGARVIVECVYQGEE